MPRRILSKTKSKIRKAERRDKRKRSFPVWLCRGASCLRRSQRYEKPSAETNKKMEFSEFGYAEALLFKRSQRYARSCKRSGRPPRFCDKKDAGAGAGRKPARAKAPSERTNASHEAGAGERAGPGDRPKRPAAEQKKFERERILFGITCRRILFNTYVHSAQNDIQAQF